MTIPFTKRHPACKRRGAGYNRPCGNYPDSPAYISTQLLFCYRSRLHHAKRVPGLASSRFSDDSLITGCFTCLTLFCTIETEIQ